MAEKISAPSKPNAESLFGALRKERGLTLISKTKAGGKTPRLPAFLDEKKRPHYYADAFVKWKTIYFKQPALLDRILSFS